MRAEKKQLVEDIRALLDSSSHHFFVSYKGLDVAQFDELRDGLAERGAQCHVMPNRLLKKAAGENGMTELEPITFRDDNALVSGGDDPVAVAKFIREFTEKNDELQVKAGTLEGRYLEAEDVKQLAKLPGREVLLAQLLGVLQAPARNLAGVLHAKLATVVYVLKNHLDAQTQQET